jgi:hypothetical protein
VADEHQPRDSEFLAWFDEPWERRAFNALAGVMLNLTDMPRWSCDESPLQRSTLTFPVYLACVNSFFTSARLAAEFFWKMPTQDITARSFVEDWSAPPAIAGRMQRVWLMTSKHIVHLSQARVPSAPGEWIEEDLSLTALMQINEDAFSSLKLFADAYDERGGEHVTRLREIYDGCRPRTVEELSRGRGRRPKPAPILIEWW